MAPATASTVPSGAESFSSEITGRFVGSGSLRYVGMPGGDQAIREPWRMAVAHLRDAGNITGEFVRRLPPGSIRTVEQMLEKGFNTPMTSSAGRLFDAVAVLAGLRDCVSYEGQAAMELEWLATGVTDSGAYSFELNETAGRSTFGSDTCRRHTSDHPRRGARRRSRHSCGDHQPAISHHDG